MITVFYDGKCGMCAKEIGHYKTIAPDGVFDWQDITERTDGLAKEGISLATGLSMLHVKDHQGKMHVGVDSFVVIWKQLGSWKLLAFFVSLPIVKQIAGLAYRIFARWRFNRLAHCQLAAKAEVNQ